MTVLVSYGQGIGGGGVGVRAYQASSYVSGASGTGFAEELADMVCLIQGVNKMIRPEKLTVKAQEALGAAQRRANDGQHAEVGPLHLVAGLLEEGEGGVVSPVLEKVGGHVQRLRQITESELDRLPKVSGGGIPVADWEERAIPSGNIVRRKCMMRHSASTGVARRGRRRISCKTRNGRSPSQ